MRSLKKLKGTIIKREGIEKKLQSSTADKLVKKNILQNENDTKLIPV